MFTGLVEECGHVADVTPQPGGDARVQIAASQALIATLTVGDSVACNGACLTVVEMADGRFAADVSNETLAVTTLGDWQAGTPVNLERSLTLSRPLGGHLVQGHVDGVANIVSVTGDASSHRVEIDAPAALAGFIAAKGSIALDGISLTVNAVDGTRFGVNIIAHTWSVTTAGDWTAGTRVNLEVDLMARYAQRLLTYEPNGRRD